MGADNDDTTDPQSKAIGVRMYAQPAERLLPHDIGHFLSASLEEVSSVTVFYDLLHSYCKGILLCYTAGTQQALGQCAIGIFPEQRTVSPQIMHYQDCESKRNPVMEQL